MSRLGLAAATMLLAAAAPATAQTGPDPIAYSAGHLAAGNTEAGIGTIRRALAKQSDAAPLHARLGYLYRYAGLTDRSIAEYRRAAALDASPANRIAAHDQIAKALIHAGDYARAAREQRAADKIRRAALQPVDEKVHLYHGIASLFAGRNAAAIHAFDAAEATGRETVWSEFARAYRLVAKGDAAGAKAAADTLARRNDVADGERHYRLAHLYAFAGDQPRAMRALDTAFAAGFFNPAALDKDPLLAPLRGTAPFAATLDRARARSAAATKSDAAPLAPLRFVLAIHGGGGVRPKAEMTPAIEAAYRADLARSLKAGHAVLEAGGSSVDAVEAAINVMEDSPLFNAGKGASFNRAGFQEMDSAIMEGRTLKAGGVGIVQHVRNPISLARRVMEKSPHVLMAAAGAEAFARAQGIALVPAHYFFTQRKWDSLQERLQLETPYGRTKEADSVGPDYAAAEDWKAFGTVGAVALDGWGNLAAGTSTGGREGKLPGRVGDSPIIGAGTYADNRTLAVSSTGLGEYVMRLVSAKDIADRMAYGGWPLARATQNAVDDVRRMGGSIGLVAVDAKGEVAMPYGGRGMYRGTIREDGAPEVRIYDQ